MPKPANLMIRNNTPTEDYVKEYGLWVKREDLSCPPPGPPFSKTRGVYAHVASRPEKLIGVLDTAHSQAGHAVARACQILGKRCVNYYPVYKAEVDESGEHELRLPQIASKDLGAELQALPAGRSCILYHAARKDCERRQGYIMPNALKLRESIDETAKEVANLPAGLKFTQVIIPASSGTIAAGVIKGFYERIGNQYPTFIVHLGYKRSHEEVAKYLAVASGTPNCDRAIIVDEGYAYKDKSKAGKTPSWPCNEYYDLKAFRWWVACGREKFAKGNTLLWNIG